MATEEHIGKVSDLVSLWKNPGSIIHHPDNNNTVIKHDDQVLNNNKINSSLRTSGSVIVGSQIVKNQNQVKSENAPLVTVKLTIRSAAKTAQQQTTSIAQKLVHHSEPPHSSTEHQAHTHTTGHALQDRISANLDKKLAEEESVSSLLHNRRKHKTETLTHEIDEYLPGQEEDESSPRQTAYIISGSPHLSSAHHHPHNPSSLRHTTEGLHYPHEAPDHHSLHSRSEIVKHQSPPSETLRHHEERVPLPAPHSATPNPKPLHHHVHPFHDYKGEEDEHIIHHVHQNYKPVSSRNKIQYDHDSLHKILISIIIFLNRGEPSHLRIFL